MTLREHFKAGYELFGPEAMQLADQFFGGEIDWDTFMDRVKEPVMNYRIRRMMWNEIEETKPKMVKVTSWFADYLQRSVVMIESEPPEHFSGGTIGHFKAIPIEIDDTIENEYYELVYEEWQNG